VSEITAPQPLQNNKHEQCGSRPQSASPPASPQSRQKSLDPRNEPRGRPVIASKEIPAAYEKARSRCTADDGLAVRRGGDRTLVRNPLHGAKVTGTGGRDDADRHQVMEGKLDGDKIVLDVEAGSAPIHLELQVRGDDMTGEASRTRGDGAKQTAKIAVKREKQ
jgi:hypothetical protein